MRGWEYSGPALVCVRDWRETPFLGAKVEDYKYVRKSDVEAGSLYEVSASALQCSAAPAQPAQPARQAQPVRQFELTGRLLGASSDHAWLIGALGASCLGAALLLVTRRARHQWLLAGDRPLRAGEGCELE